MMEIKTPFRLCPSVNGIKRNQWTCEKCLQNFMTKFNFQLTKTLEAIGAQIKTQSKKPQKKSIIFQPFMQKLNLRKLRKLINQKTKDN